MRLFSVRGKYEHGLGCDCCVVVVSFHADVFADDPGTARELALTSFIPCRAKVDSIGIEERGNVTRVETPGMKIISETEIWRGSHTDSPF